MNCYAIVLGVDKYKNHPQLQSCENDANMIEKLLLSTGKYNVLRIPNNSSKYEVQEQISSFLPDDVSDISEVLFYFSGHGKQDEQDMHYALFETDINKISSTSLNNNELDDIVRKCSPKLYVKIIDACQSGLTYIKGTEPLFSEPEFTSTKGFQNCFFMCSSLNSQPSYAGNPYSKFTKAVIDAIKSIQAPVVKFTDIQNYLSDVFKGEGGAQTPYFSTQCDGTEIFCEKNPEVIKFLTENESVDVVDGKSTSDVEAVKLYLDRCREEDDVKGIMEKVLGAINDWELDNSLLSEFYDIYCDNKFPYVYHRYHEDSGIVKTLYSKAEKENLFIQVECKSVKKENPLANPFFNSYKEVPVSYRSLANTLPGIFSIHFKAKNSSLPDYVIPFIFVYSSTFFYVFTCTKQFVRKAWMDYEEGQASKYVYTKFGYDEFTEADWGHYLSKRTGESVEFIERTLKEYINI